MMENELKARGFYLGGSRRMAEKYPDLIHVNQTTDFDFNAQHSDETIHVLKSLGFEQKFGSDSYIDDQAVTFWSYGLVTVITRKDINTYIKAFESIRVEDYLWFHWKSSQCLKVPFNKCVTRDYFNALFLDVRQK